MRFHVQRKPKRNTVTYKDGVATIGFPTGVEMSTKLWLLLGAYRMKILMVDDKWVGIQGEPKVLRGFLADNGATSEILKQFDDCCKEPVAA